MNRSINEESGPRSNDVISRIRSDIEIQRRRNSLGDPFAHIQRVFGPNVEFTEVQLVSPMDPEMIKHACMKLFNLERLTREDLKYILREGARANTILRLTDDCFENMVDGLNLSLDPEIGYNDNQADSKDFMHTTKKNGAKENKNNDVETESLNSVYEHSHSNNLLMQCKDSLQKIIDIEKTIYLKSDEKAGNDKYNDNSVMPLNIDNETIVELKSLKARFKELVKNLLNKRAHFHNIMGPDKNIDESVDIVTDMDGDITEYVKSKDKENSQSFKLFVEIRKPYYKIFLALIIISLVAFLVMGVIAGSYDYADYIGPWIVVSRA